MDKCKLYNQSPFCREAVESRQLEKHEVMSITSKTEVAIYFIFYSVCIYYNIISIHSVL